MTSNRVKNLTKRYDGANDGPVSPTRDRSLSSIPLYNRPYSAPRLNSHSPPHEIQCVGESDIIYINIVYYTSVCDAQKKQTEIEGHVPKVPDATDKPAWFSDKDFEQLAQTIKHVSPLAIGILSIC